MTMTQQTWTVNAIKDANRAAGYHWFDPQTMRSFGTKVLPTVYSGPGGVFFVTRDKDFDGKPGYTVRQFTPEDSHVNTVGNVAILSKSQAIAIARNKATAGHVGTTAAETSEDFRPVSTLEQFLHDLRAHGRPDATEDDAKELMRLAARHHKAAERECNEGGDFTTRIESKIDRLGLNVGARGFRFSGDPRGCTVKIIFADGATNDFGNEGWCVPTGE